MKVKCESEVAQSCLTFSDPLDCSPPGFSIHGIFQARVLEWGAISFSFHMLDHIYSHSFSYNMCIYHYLILEKNWGSERDYDLCKIIPLLSGTSRKQIGPGHYPWETLCLWFKKKKNLLKSEECLNLKETMKALTPVGGWMPLPVTIDSACGDSAASPLGPRSMTLPSFWSQENNLWALCCFFQKPSEILPNI